MTLEQAMKTERDTRDVAPVFVLNSALHGGGWSTPHPSRFTPRKETRYLLYMMLSLP